MPLPLGRPQALLANPINFSLLSAEPPPLGRTGALALTLCVRPGGPCPRLSDGTLAPMRPSIGPSRDIFSNQGPRIKKAVLPQAKRTLSWFRSPLNQRGAKPSLRFKMHPFRASAAPSLLVRLPALVLACPLLACPPAVWPACLLACPPACLPTRLAASLLVCPHAKQHARIHSA